LLFSPPACGTYKTTQTDCESSISEAQARGAVYDGTWADECLAGLAASIPAPPTVCLGLDLEDYLTNHRADLGFNEIPACRKLYTAGHGLDEACEYQGFRI